MPRIKIVSNPYRKDTSYQKWDVEESQWINIDYDNNRNSKLLNQELMGGFFPFRAKKIVDLILEEYGIADETVGIVFEGSVDEYNELEAVCNDEVYNL